VLISTAVILGDTALYIFSQLSACLCVYSVGEGVSRENKKVAKGGAGKREER